MLKSEKLQTRVAESRAKMRLVPLLPKIAPQSKWTPSRFLDLHADKRPQSVAIKFLDERITWRELDVQVNQCAGALAAIGIEKGDKVALLMDNRPQFIVILLAISRLQGIAVLLNTSITGKSLVHCLNIASVNTMVVGQEHADKLLPILDDLSGLSADQVWMSQDPYQSEMVNEAQFASFDELLSGETQQYVSEDFPQNNPSIMDTCCYIYTSGTTGLPKAAIVTNQRLLAMGAMFDRMMFDLKTSDTVYVTSPLYHSMGLNAAFGSTLISGASMALRRRFSASEFWQDVRRFRATIFVYIGELCRYLANQPASDDDKNHSIRAMGGVGLRPDVWRIFNERFGIHAVREVYGATEGSGGLFNVTGKVGMMGRQQPGQVILRCDLSTGEVERNAEGECEKIAEGETGLLANYVSVLTPYDGYVDAEATDKKLMRDVFKSGDCYFNTGDLVTLHEDKWLSFADRVGDTFRWKGENVSTNEVAEALNALDGVLEANVYGVVVPGNEGKAGMASLNIDHRFDLAALAALVAKDLTSYQKPFFVRLQKDMRITQTFKHQKVDYAREGYNPLLVKDELFILQEGSYVALTKTLYEGVNNGDIALR